MRKLIFLLLPFIIAAGGKDGIDIPSSATIDGITSCVSSDGVTIVDVGEGCTPCSALQSNAVFLWNAEYNADCAGGQSSAEEHTACVDGDVLEGTLTGTTVTTDQNNTGGGAKSHYIDGSSGEALYFTVTGKNIFDSAEGFIEMYIYAPNAGSNRSIVFEARYDSNNYFYVSFDSDLTPYVYFRHGGTATINDDNADAMNTAAWNKIEVRWDTGVADKLEVQINTGDWVNHNDDDAMGAFATEPAQVSSGEYLMDSYYADDYYIDDITIWDTYDKS